MTDTTYRNIVLTVIALLGTALYIHTLGFPFVFDGEHYLVKNPLIKDFRYYGELLTPRRFAQIDELLKIDPDLTTNFMLRPVSYLTFSLNYFLGDLNPAGYRAVNIAIHILNAVLLYLFTERLLRPSPHHRTLDRASLRFIPTVAALFFLVHPLQTLSVTYIIQRFTSLGTVFYLLTLYLYLLSIQSDEQGRATLFQRLSLLTLIVGMLVKELMFTAPFMLLLMELVVLGTSLKAALRRALPHLLCLPLIPVMTAVCAALQNNSAASVSGSLNVVNYSHYPITAYLFTQLCVITTYLRMLLLPYGQNIDPDYPLYTSLLQGRVLLSLALLVALLAVAFFLFRRERRDLRYALAFFGTAWFFLAISIDSSIVPLPDLMAEQRVYLPSVGLFLLLAAMTDLLRTRLTSAPIRKGLLAVMVAWGIVLCGVTLVRNEVWHSEISIWQDTTAKSPRKARAWHSLAMAYAIESRYEEAVPCFEKAAGIFMEQKRYGETAEECVKGLTLDPSNAELYRILGVSYTELGQLDDAEYVLRQSLDINPGNGSTRLALARVFLAKKQVGAAREQMSEAVKNAGSDPRQVEEIRELEKAVSATGER
jgi:tetratricopeptide (TPR) repeat protein